MKHLPNVIKRAFNIHLYPARPVGKPYLPVIAGMPFAEDA
jgi:hypothetical protein